MLIPDLLAVHLEVGLDWNDHEIVLRLAEDTSLSLCYPDYFERPALDLNHFADRIGVRKELLPHVIADKSYVEPFFILGLGEEAPGDCLAYS